MVDIFKIHNCVIIKYINHRIAENRFTAFGTQFKCHKCFQFSFDDIDRL